MAAGPHLGHGTPSSSCLEAICRKWLLGGNKFSAIPIDQAHEQNKIVNGSVGAVGLTENPTAFRKWMVAGPEQARIIQEFEDTYMTADTNDEGQSAQKSFRDQVSSLVDVIREMGNPFKDDFVELVTQDSRNCMEEAVVSTVWNIESLGKTKYHEYMNDVVEQRTRSIHDPIKRNSLPLFKHTSTKKKSKKAEQAMYSDRARRLYISDIGLGWWVIIIHKTVYGQWFGRAWVVRAAMSDYRLYRWRPPEVTRDSHSMLHSWRRTCLRLADKCGEREMC